MREKYVIHCIAACCAIVARLLAIVCAIVVSKSKLLALLLPSRSLAAINSDLTHPL